MKSVLLFDIKRYAVHDGPGIRTTLTLYDLKHMDCRQHHLYTGAGNETIPVNLAMPAGDDRPMEIRFPLIPGINDDTAHAKQLGIFLHGLSGI